MSGNAPSVSSFCETPEEAAEMLVAGAVPGDVILVKGSRGVMEIVVERLKAAFGSAKNKKESVGANVLLHFL